MKIPTEGQLLRIFVGEGDKTDGKPLYEAIVQMARSEGLAGATAVKGFMGFGCKSHMHTAKLLRLSEDLPVIIEIVDSEKKIAAFLKKVEGIVREGLITLENVKVILYRAEGSEQ